MHRLRPWLAVPVVCSIALGTAVPARADAEDQAAAEALFSDGRELFRAGKISEACRKFASSYSLDKAAGTLLNLALCHEKEGKIASAWAEYREAMVEARRTGRTDRLQVATDAAAALEPQLPKLTIVVPNEGRAKDLEIQRNAAVLPPGGWGTPLPVDPGEVVIDARAPLRVPWSTKIAIQAGETATVTVPPLVIDQTAVAAAAARHSAVTSWWTGRRTAAVTLGAAALVAAGVGTYFGVLALDSKSQASSRCPGYYGEVRCYSDGASASQRANEQAWVSNITIGVGVLAALGSAYLFATGAPQKVEAPPPAKAKVDLTWVGSLGGAVRVRW